MLTPVAVPLPEIARRTQSVPAVLFFRRAALDTGGVSARPSPVLYRRIAGFRSWPRWHSPLRVTTTTIIARMANAFADMATCCRSAHHTSIVMSGPLSRLQVRYSGMMQPLMFSVCHHLQVFETVIRRIAIDMVDKFGPGQVTPEVLFHHQPMFSDCSVGMRGGMRRHEDVDVSGSGILVGHREFLSRCHAPGCSISAGAFSCPNYTRYEPGEPVPFDVRHATLAQVKVLEGWT